MPRRSVVTLLATVVALGAVGDLTAAQTQSAAAAPSTAEVLRSKLPPPPRSFDPEVIPYVGSPAGRGAEPQEPLYLGAVDGSGLVQVAGLGVAEAWVAGAGRILMSMDVPGTEARPLVVRDPDGTVRPLVPAMESIVLSADGDTAYGFTDTGELGGPLLRIPLDGSPITETGLRAHLGYDVFVSPDERSLAVTMGADAAARASVLFDAGSQRPIGPVTPVGFDARSRLIRAGWWFRALDPDEGLGRRLLDGRPFHYGYATPDGRYLVAAWGGDRQFVILDLRNGRRTDLRLPGPGDWTLRRPGIDRYVVLQHSLGGGAVDGVVIHDLIEGWTGYLPWRGFEAASNTTPAPSPSASTITPSTPRCTIRDPHQPAPSDGFDASAIPWIGDQWGYHEAEAIYGGGRSVWVGALDGSGQRAIVSPELIAAHLLADGSVVVVRATQDASELVVIGRDGSERVLAPRIDDSTIGIDPAGRNIYAWHQGPDPYLTIGDVWRIPLDGSPAEVVLVEIGSPRELFVSPDGSTVAVGWDGGDDGPYWTVVRRGDRPQMRLKNAVPVGIDAGGRVVVIENEGITRVDPGSGRRSTFPLHGRYPEEASLTPSGRTLLMDWTDKAGRITTISARNLRSGRTQTWRLPSDADWYLTDLGTDRYIVLGREEDLTTTEWAIVDLETDRLGFLPFCPPAMSTGCSPSVTP